MVKERDLATTSISMRYDLSPTKNIIGDMSGVIGEFCDEFIGAFYSRNVSKKANIVITELFDNAIENSEDGNGRITLELSIDGEHLRIRMMNNATRSQYRKVRDHVKEINSSANLKEMLADTIRKRREGRLKGGLGLIRLAAENKFQLSVRYRRPCIMVETGIALGGPD